jgi:hypothetical protein
MDSGDWKLRIEEDAPKMAYVPFMSCRKFFAVDDSGSTAGAVLQSERDFVELMRGPAFAHKNDKISLWGERCDEPTMDFDNISWKSTHGGTDPLKILHTPTALEAIQKSDVSFLVTDGQIYDAQVYRLAEKAYSLNILNVPLVFVVVGSRGRTPETTDISVGISFYAGAQDTLILFKEVQTGKIFVIAGKGCFSSLGGSADPQYLQSWANLSVFTCEQRLFNHCSKLNIKIPEAKARRDLPKGVNLGKEWEKANGGPVWVELDKLLQAGVLSDKEMLDLFAEETFTNLAVAYKTRQRIADVRTFVLAQKNELVPPKFEDVAGGSTIIAKMGSADITDAERSALQEKLREAHTKNRAHYQKMMSDFDTSPEAQRVRKRNKLVDAAMRTLASIENSGFDAELLARKSNRARRAAKVPEDNNLDMAKLDLEGPAFRGDCLICCGEDEIMCISLKEMSEDHKEDNTTDFALNFPLAAGCSKKNVDMISSQNICFQCALLSPEGLSVCKYHSVQNSTEPSADRLSR